LSGDIKSTSKKLTWLADIPDLLNVTLVSYDHLLTVQKLDENDTNWLETSINKNSKHDIDAVADANMRVLKRGDKLQLERRGYYIVDEPHVRDGVPMILIEIPDGHTNEKGASVLTANMRTSSRPKK